MTMSFGIGIGKGDHETNNLQVKKSETTNAWIWEDRPGFIALFTLTASSSLFVVVGIGSYNLIHMIFNFCSWDLTIVLQ